MNMYVRNIGAEEVIQMNKRKAAANCVCFSSGFNFRNSLNQNTRGGEYRARKSEEQ